MNGQKSDPKTNRRTFLRSITAAGAGLTLAPKAFAASKTTAEPDPIHVALIGTGAQGLVLMSSCLRIPGVRFQAVCDMWEAYALKRVTCMLNRYGNAVKAYTDYEELLEKERGLDAVLIATPDCWHARHAIAALKAGLHVYCEEPMSNTVEDAHRMVEAARESGRHLQIGHQRRSNPRYLLCKEKLLREAELIGRITAVNGQWNRPTQPPLGYPSSAEIDANILRHYGYESMQQFRNWRWYRQLGGGPVVDRGAHQLDVYNWFLGTPPKSVTAVGCMNTYQKHGFEWPDTVMVICEYDSPQGPVQASYQVLSANSSFGYFEAFLGERGTLVISEASRYGEAYPEPWIDQQAWSQWVKKGYLRPPHDLKDAELEFALPMYRVAETPPPVLKQLPYKLAVQMKLPRHQPHLENFFEAIRGSARLNCPAEVGYQAAVTVLKINEAIEAGRKVDLKAEDFIA